MSTTMTRDATQDGMTPPDGRDVAEAAVDLEGLERLAKAATPGPWTQHPLFPRYVVPASHARRSVGGSVLDDEDREHYAQIITDVDDDRHGRGSAVTNAAFIAAANPATVLHLIARARAASPQEHDQGGGDVEARAKAARKAYQTTDGDAGIRWIAAIKAADALRPTPATAGEPSTAEEVLAGAVAAWARRANCLDQAILDTYGPPTPNQGEPPEQFGKRAARAILALRTAPASSLEGGGEVMEALFKAAAHHQGGHSDVGEAISRALGVPFPLDIVNLSDRACALGLDPGHLYPWSATAVHISRVNRAALAPHQPEGR